VAGFLEALASALEQACLTPTLRERADWNGNVSQMEELFVRMVGPSAES